MRTRKGDSSSKSATPKKTPPARKSAGETPAAKRTPASKTRNAKKMEASPAPDPTPDSNPDQSPQEQKSLARATTSKSAKRKTPGRPRTKVVAATPNLEEELEAAADETPIVDNSKAAEKVEEPGNVEAVDADNIESKEATEQGVGSVGLSDEKEHNPMEVDEPVVEKVCELVEKGKSMGDVEVTASQDASVSFKRPGHTIVDLNISVADNEDYTGAQEGEEELKIQEGERGKEDMKEQDEEKGKEDLKEQEGEKGKEELEQQEGDKEMEEFKEQEGEKGKEELNQQKREKEMEEFIVQEGEKGKEELQKQEGDKEMEEFRVQEGGKGKEELKEQKGEKGKEVLKGSEGEKEKEELREQEGEKGKEEFKEEGLEKAKGKETNIIGNEEHSNAESFSVEAKAQLQKDVNPEKHGVEGPKSGEMLDLGEQGREELDEEDPEEPPEETETLEEEHMELEAIAKQRKIKKEHEIFVGGLDRDATEEDLRKVFQRIGEVVEVRLHKNSSTNKNKGYAFVKFASKEHAKKALSEMKNPVIHGKRCGTAPSEDNDTLFLGNICNTWTKEAIKQKLKDYGIEGIENICTRCSTCRLEPGLCIP